MDDSKKLPLTIIGPLCQWATLISTQRRSAKSWNFIDSLLTALPAVKWFRDDSQDAHSRYLWIKALHRNYHKPIYNSFRSSLPPNHPYHWLIIPFYHLYSESHYHTQIDIFFDSPSLRFDAQLCLWLGRRNRQKRKVYK